MGEFVFGFEPVCCGCVAVVFDGCVVGVVMVMLGDGLRLPLNRVNMPPISPITHTHICRQRPTYATPNADVEVSMERVAGLCMYA